MRTYEKIIKKIIHADRITADCFTADLWPTADLNG